MIKYTCGAGTPEEAETNCTYFIRGECTASFCEYRRKKQTNADSIRSMSDEELAKLLCCTGWRMIEQKECLEWLQQPAEEDDHAICGATNLPCIRCNPGGCDNRKEGADNDT